MCAALSIPTSTLSSPRAAPIARRAAASPTEPLMSFQLRRTDELTIYLLACLPACLTWWLACAALVMLLLCHQIGASLAPSRPPASLPPSLRRQTEKAKRRREKKSWLINPATTVGALARARLLIGRGGRPGPRRLLARSGDVYLPA